MKQRSMWLMVLMLAWQGAWAHPTITEGWVRLLPPNMKMTSAYAQVSTSHADKILSVSTEVAKSVELHETTMADGKMSMRPVTAFEIEENGSIELKPHGKHLMLKGLKRELKEGEVIPFVFTLEQSDSIVVDFVVRKP